MVSPSPVSASCGRRAAAAGICYILSNHREPARRDGA
ncbi:unnamed protein product [Phaeothamnion confervicola]